MIGHVLVYNAYVFCCSFSRIAFELVAG